MNKGFSAIEILIVIVILAMVMVVTVPAFIKYSKKQEQVATETTAAKQEEVNKLKNRTPHDSIPIDKIIFFKEPRTGLCFAYTYVGYADGGPAMATVSCEVVQNFLANQPPSASNAEKK